MSIGNITVYIKGDQSVEVQKRDVTLGDIVSMECTNSQIVAKLKTVKLLKVHDSKKHRYVVSILKIIEKKRAKYDDEKLVSYLCRQGFSYQLARNLVRTYEKD